MAATDEEGVCGLARVFFNAATKASDDSEDILPQEDGEDMKLSVFCVFAGLFPEAVGENGAGVKNKRMRLHFNKIGYSMYGKEQSRRVPSLRAKPGNPGYGFRRARWRDTLENEADRHRCEAVLKEAGLEKNRVETILVCVQQVRHEWDKVRRPSRPAGPGRPRACRADGDGKVKIEEGADTSGSQSPYRSDELSAEPRQYSPATRHDSAASVDRRGPDGGCKEGHQDTAERTRDFVMQMPLPAIDLRENRESAADSPSPALKRWRENDDIFSPSIYPRLTALKLISPCNTPKPSPGQLAGFRKYECSPLLNRSQGSPGDGPCASREQDPSLLLPPLALPLSASASTQPAGGLEERRMKFHRHGSATIKAIVTPGSLKNLPSTPLHRIESVEDYPEPLRRGCPGLSALEFLADAAAAQRVSSV